MTVKTVSRNDAKIVIPPDGEIVTVSRWITPATAKLWLEKNETGRPLSRLRVAKYVHVLRDDRWRHTHQGVAFNPDGGLLDGQHRLTAIVESGISARMQVSFGVVHFAVVDTGKSRSNGDILGIAGLHNGRALAAAIRLLGPYYDGIKRPWNINRIGPDAEIVLDLALLHGDDINEQSNFARQIARRVPTMNNASTTAGLYVAARWAAANGFTTEFESWRDGLVTGLELGKDGRVAIASWSAKAARNLHSGQRSEVLLMLLLRIFHAYISGEELVRMQVNNPATYTYRLPGDTDPAARQAWLGTAPPAGSE
jgi:hypothetical protein